MTWNLKKTKRNLLNLNIFFLLLTPCYAQILESLENNQDQSPIIIDAKESVVCDEIAHKCIATGLAKAQKGTSTVYGDVLTVYFTKDRDIIAVTADGHVRIETPTETAYGEHAHYDVALDRIVMTEGDLKLVTPKETLTAKDSIEYWHTENKGIAKGNAVVELPAQKQLVQADTLVSYFTPAKEGGQTTDRAITAVTADGHVRMKTPTETASGEHAHYDVALDRVLMTGGDLKLVTPKETLTAKKSIEYWHTKNKGIAKGNAVIQFLEQKQLVQADTLIAYFIPAKEGEKKTELERVEAIGNVLASSPKGIVTGKRATYYGKTELVEVFENVKINQEGNIITGEYGRANLKTNLAEIYPYPPHSKPTGCSKRISGIIIPKDVKKSENL